MHKQKITRRKMLKTGAAVAAVFSIVPRHVLGQGCVAPSDTMSKGILGWGNMAKSHPGYNPGPTIAVSDCDSGRLSGAPNHDKVDSGAGLYDDWRELIARDDIDYVHIATPPHWHALMVIAAAEAGKDIHCEKPFTRTIGEGIRAVEACERNGTILRINTWGRATTTHGYGRSGGMSCHDLKKLVNSGLLGTPLTAVIGKQFGHNMKVDESHTVGHINDLPTSVPAELDYNMWLGPRPWKPYFAHRVHWNFRAYWDYDAGGMGDMGFHYVDPIQYYLGKDEESPVEIIPASSNQTQHPDACLPWKRVEAKYGDRTRLIFDIEEKEVNVLEGPNGWVKPNWESNISNLKAQVDAMPAISPGNTNFIECVKSREKFCLNEVNAHRTCTLMNLCTIAIRLGRTIKWDPDKNEVVGDDQANRLVWEPMRAPWNLDGKGV